MPDDRPPTPPDAASPVAKPEAGRDMSLPKAERPGLLTRLRQRLGGAADHRIRENLEEVLGGETGTNTAAFSEEERSMLRNILELRTSRVGDLMVPRADIVAAQRNTPLQNVLELFESATLTRLVVYDDTLDDPVGMVHIKDLLFYLYGEAKKSQRGKTRTAPAATLDLGKVKLDVPLAATKLIRPVLFVPPSMPALDLLEKMQASRIQLALVVDEYGGTDGLVVIKDIVEAVVGDIDDEHEDDSAPSIVAQANGRMLADARASLEELAEALGPDFSPGEDIAEEVDTLGGYLATLAGHLPVRGEVISGPNGFEFEVLDADPRRVKRVRITRASAKTAAPKGPPTKPADSTTSAGKSAAERDATPPTALPAPQEQPSRARVDGPAGA